MIKFQCLRCGQCCRKLIICSVEEAFIGLSLFPEEIEYFPKEMISPCRGVGKYPEDKDFEVFMFQLNTEPCPNIEKVGNITRCKIYANRPLACRRYPFEPIDSNEMGEPITQIDPKCMAFQNVERNKKIEIPQIEWESCTILFERLRRIRSGQRWIFDLDEKEWHVSVPPTSYFRKYIDRWRRHVSL